jgi:hypothetical protein
MRPLRWLIVVALAAKNRFEALRAVGNGKFV